MKRVKEEKTTTSGVTVKLHDGEVLQTHVNMVKIWKRMIKDTE